MANPKQDSNAARGPEAAPAFEQSLADLQQIVGDLEDGTLGLEESMRRFEKGIELLRVCYQTLERAEQKIELLTGFDGAGRPVTEPFDGTATIEQSKTAAGRRKRTATANAAETVEANGETADDDSDGTLF